MVFEDDLQFGREAEEYVLEMLKQTEWPDSKLNDSEDYECRKAYDIINSEFTVEVKYDRKAVDTGNIFIETRCNQVASGLAGTKADFWVHVIEEGAWGARVDRLRELVDRDISVHGSIKSMAGDGMRVEGIVFSKGWMATNLKRIGYPDNSFFHSDIVSLFYKST